MSILPRTEEYLKDGKNCDGCKYFKFKRLEKPIQDKDWEFMPTDISGDYLFEKYHHIYCEAFPDGIPEDVYFDGHDKPRPDIGQKNKIIFDYDPNTLESPFWDKWNKEVNTYDDEDVE